MSSSLVWVAAAAVVGFAVAAVFAGRLSLKRNAYLLFYVPIAAALIVLFYRWSDVDPAAQIGSNWPAGLVGAVVVGVIAVRNVLSQPPSPRRTGSAFVLDLIWPGLAYGLVDGMLLSVMPIMAVLEAASGEAWAATPVGHVALAALSLAASLIVTLAYHVGYPEFRGKRVVWTLVGNGLFSLAYLVTGNPLAAVLPHIAMHIASVTHGLESTIQLPPHYESEQARSRG
jgi:hypothetical protein